MISSAPRASAVTVEADLVPRFDEILFETAALAERWPQFITNFAYDSNLVEAS